MRPRITLLAVLTAVLGACSGGAPQPSAQPSATAGASNPPSVAGGPMVGNRTFVSTAITGRTLAAGTKVTLTFKDGQLGASAGCNSMGGAYFIVGDTLRIDQLGSTEMGCAPDLMAQDQWLAAFLPDATVDLRAAGLTLTKGGVVLELVDRQTTNVPLQGTMWVVDTLISGGTASSMPQGVMATLVFTAQGYTVHTGCNSGAGTAAIGKGTITFGTPAVTAMLCSDEAMAVEKHVLTVLAGVRPFAVDGPSLTIGAPDGPGVVLQATSGPPPSDPGPS